MKKYRLCFLVLTPILFFSCGSTPKEVENSDIEIQAPVEEITEDKIEESEVEPETEADEAEDLEEETLNTEEPSDIEIVDETDPNDIHRELEEIIEPEVIDLEPPLEEEPEVIVEPEPIPDIEKEIEELPPVETKLNDSNPETESEFQDSEVTIPEEEITVVEDTDSIEVVDEDDSDEPAVVDTDEVEVLDEGDDEEVAVEEEIIIIPSRSVTMKKQQFVDFTYPGNGWIFMGLTDNSKDLVYNGRKIGTENTNFSLQAKNSGTKIVHFYKNDALTGEFIDDYVEVIISEEKGSNKDHIKAPDYKTPLPKKAVENKKNTVEEEQTVIVDKKNEIHEKSEATKQPGNIKTESSVKKETVKPAPVEKIDTPVEVQSPVVQIDVDQLYKTAKEQFEAQNYSDAEKNLKQYLELATANRDEVLYLLGQLYETQGANQNISEAIKSYTTLTNNYPASKYWDSASKRIIYLKRFYMEGR